MAYIHQGIEPIKARVRKEFLYNMDPKYQGEFENCTLFGLSSYAGDALTFQTVLDNGSLFSYVPFHAVKQREVDSELELELSDLVYHNCPSANFTSVKFPFLEGRVNCYFRKKDLWVQGDYLLTLDWYDDNLQTHLLALDNGQYATLPNHKVKFKNLEECFERYEKMRSDWRV